MIYRLLADCLVVVHFAFVIFVVAGGFLVLWRPFFRWIHLPAAAWGALIELTGWICPLIPWEQALRVQAGQVGYSGGFIEHYILSLLYPQGLTPAVQTALAFLVIGVTIAFYACVWHRARASRRRRLSGATGTGR
jgi:hypothetical protein